MALSLGAALSKGGTTVDLSYVDQMGDETDNTREDMDFVSFSISHAF